jgi:putative redox protein
MTLREGHAMRSERFEFPNVKGHKLAAALEVPLGVPTAYVLFAHCFTCGRNNLAAKRISERLAEQGLAVLRFDFTGLGDSEGDFANTNFSSNLDDLVTAAGHLRQTKTAPTILIGHSLGGAAVLAAAHRIAEARAVVTIGAPFDPSHVVGLFKNQLEAIRRDGEAEVTLAGRPFRIGRSFLDDISEQTLKDRLATLKKPLLIFHSPTDNVVGVDNATRIFVNAKHPKSFISLAGADHLLSRKNDAHYVADVAAAWVGRFLDQPKEVARSEGEKGVVLVRESGEGKFQQEIVSGTHRLIADEPVSFGGLDTGPGPYDLLLAALGACTSMTVRLYAEHKNLPLERVSVRLSRSKIHATDCEKCETKEGMLDRIERSITFEGPLDADQRKRLLEIADKCPVHRTLTSEIDIRTVEELANAISRTPQAG